MNHRLIATDGASTMRSEPSLGRAKTLQQNQVF